MLQRPIDHHTALIFTMVLVSAAEGVMTDAELEAIGRQVRYLPVFRGFDHDRLTTVGRNCAELLRKEDGLDVACDMIAEALVAAPARDGLCRGMRRRGRGRRAGGRGGATCSSSCADASVSIAWSRPRSSVRPTRGTSAVEMTAPMPGHLAASLCRDGGVLSIAQMSAAGCGGGRRRRSRPHADGERGQVGGRRYHGPLCGGAGHGPLRAGQQRRRRLRRREAAGAGGLGGARRADRRSGAAEGRCGRRCPRLAGRCDAGRSCGARRRRSGGRCAVRRRPHAAGRGTGARRHRGPAAITLCQWSRSICPRVCMATRARFSAMPRRRG